MSGAAQSSAIPRRSALYISCVLTAGESVFSMAAALAAVATLGYVAGSLLVEGKDEDFGLAWAVIRTVAGLLLTTAGFLASLVLSLPWYAGPAALVAATIAVRRTAAFSRPHAGLRIDADRIAAAVLAGLIVSPILITAFYMARGSFPPVFFNIDTAYAMEKVHALSAGQAYPPESLSNLGIQRTSHYGTQAMAALIARASGLLPHHAMFAIVLPLLTAGVLAAAALAARLISPNVPRSVAVPLLLVSVPTLANPFWERFGRQLWVAVTTAGLGLRAGGSLAHGHGQGTEFLAPGAARRRHLHRDRGAVLPVRIRVELSGGGLPAVPRPPDARPRQHPRHDLRRAVAAAPRRDRAQRRDPRS